MLKYIIPFPAVGLAAVSNVTAVFCAITLVVPPVSILLTKSVAKLADCSLKIVTGKRYNVF